MQHAAAAQGCHSCSITIFPGNTSRVMLLLQRSALLSTVLLPAAAKAFTPGNLSAPATVGPVRPAIFVPRGGAAGADSTPSADKRSVSSTKRNMIGSILDLLAGSGDYELIKPDQALPGRSQPMANIEGSRHYVLGTDMTKVPPGHKVAVFANGCFWGSEKGIWRLPPEDGGVYSTAVGYCAGFTPNPTYEEACSGRTGHTEGVRVVYDPEKISFVDIMRWFWEAHDPTSGMGQGNDRGTQYRSGFYYFDDEQKQLLEASKEAYEKQLGRPITTEIAAASDYDQYGGLWYYAEPYHQQYLAKPGSRPYCSAQPQGVALADFDSWCPEALKEKHAPKLPESFWKKHAPKRGCSVVQESNEPISESSY